MSESTKITRLTGMQVDALREQFDPDYVTVTAQTATFAMSPSQALGEVRTRLAQPGAPKALHAVARKLEKMVGGTPDAESRRGGEFLRKGDRIEIVVTQGPEIVTVVRGAKDGSRAQAVTADGTKVLLGRQEDGSYAVLDTEAAYRGETKVKRPRKAAAKVETDESFGRTLHDALAKNGLTAGALARQLEVEPGVVAKYAKGLRQPRPNAQPGSIAAKLAAWVKANA